MDRAFDNQSDPFLQRIKKEKALAEGSLDFVSKNIEDVGEYGNVLNEKINKLQSVW
jgi:hypothetical protein